MKRLAAKKSSYPVFDYGIGMIEYSLNTNSLAHLVRKAIGRTECVKESYWPGGLEAGFTL